ncbi:MAG: pyrroline-5-carboxylate reductase [Opitutaceae bacterium]
MSKIAFLGAGNMAAAMVQGLIAKQVSPPEDIACYTASGKSAAVLAQAAGIRQATAPADLMHDADLLVVAFKPQHLSGLDATWRELTAGKLVLSVLSGKTLARLQTVFPAARNWVRTMPNTPGRIGAGITGWCAARPLTEGDRKAVHDLLGALGRELETTESKLDAITAVSGSGPGYVFEFAAALQEAAQNAGLTAEQARLLVIETLLGSARLLARTGESPDRLRDQVTSPNGTTLAGLNVLKAGGFRSLVTKTVLAAKARAEEISQES